MYGTLLGDASLNKTSKGGNFNLTLTHSPKQKEYLEFKKQLFEQISHVRFSYKEVNFFNKQVKKTYKTCYYQSNYLKYFTKLEKIFYTDTRKKIVNRKILNKLTPLALAIWWMDDGSLVIYNRKDRNAVNRYATLATCSFTIEENLEIIKYFSEVWGITPQLKFVSRKYPVLKFPMLEFNKLVKIIEPYIIPSMHYKIDFKYKS